MHSEHRLSVVIPLYNKRDTIERAIKSILAQAVDDIEILVVDDGSTDDSAARAAAIDDARITLIRQANAGPGRARNVGAKAGRAPLIAFLDADDEWLPGYLAAGIEALDRHPAAVAYACSYETGSSVYSASDRVSRVTPVPALLDPPAASIGDWPLRHHLHGLHSSSTIVRRAAFERAGGYYDRERCLWGEDSYLWSQILFMGPIFWDPVPRIVFHVEDSALGLAVQTRQKARPLALLTDEMLRGIPPEHHAAFRVLARAIASDDTRYLLRAGLVGRWLSLRARHGLWHPKSIARDGIDYVGYIRSRMRGTP